MSAPRCSSRPAAEDECSVCKDMFLDHDAVLLNCGHSFHCSCAQQWFRQQQPCSCPLCRSPFEVRHHYNGAGESVDEPESWRALREEIRNRPTSFFSMSDSMPFFAGDEFPMLLFMLLHQMMNRDAFGVVMMEISSNSSGSSGEQPTQGFHLALGVDHPGIALRTSSRRRTRSQMEEAAAPPPAAAPHAPAESTAAPPAPAPAEDTEERPAKRTRRSAAASAGSPPDGSGPRRTAKR